MRQLSLPFSSIEAKNHIIDSNICEIESVFLLLTALIRNFYKFLMGRIDAKAFGLKENQPHQSLRLQVHQRARKVDKDGKALSAEHLFM